jgi:hypothetical protein
LVVAKAESADLAADLALRIAELQEFLLGRLVGVCPVIRNALTRRFEVGSEKRRGASREGERQKQAQ